MLLAQRGGHGVGGGRPPAGASNPAPTNSELKDFNRAIALQATPDQEAQFHELTESTEAARKEAQNLIQHTENGPNSSRYSDLNNAVEEARRDNQQFVRSFSAPQQTGLKPLTKKLSKSDSDVSKQGKALTQEVERSPTDGKKMADIVEKLDKALTGFQSGQLDIGKEMGIQPEKPSQ
jgi:vacuolar-type H+-ATPase subunit H